MPGAAAPSIPPSHTSNPAAAAAVLTSVFAQDQSRATVEGAKEEVSQQRGLVAEPATTAKFMLDSHNSMSEIAVLAQKHLMPLYKSVAVSYREYKESGNHRHSKLRTDYQDRPHIASMLKITGFKRDLLHR